MKNFVLLLGYSLVEDVCRAKDYDSEEWWNVFNNMILQTLKLKNCYLLSESAKLATAMTIIGSRKFMYYPLAFQLLRIWSTTGGCYWVVQEEILRHYILFKIRELIDCEKLQQNGCIIIQYLNNELQSIDLSVATKAHEILYVRINKLKKEAIDFIKHILDSRDALEIFYRYCGNYPLSSFISWFLNWGNNLLVMYHSNHYHIPVLLRLQQDLECKKHLNTCIKSIQSSVSAVSKTDIDTTSNTTVFKLLSTDKSENDEDENTDIDHIMKLKTNTIRNRDMDKITNLYLNKTQNNCLDHTAMTTISDSNNISSIKGNNNMTILDTISIGSMSHTTDNSSSFNLEYQYEYAETEQQESGVSDNHQNLFTHLKRSFWQIFTP